jgi:hypothetical protein
MGSVKINIEGGKGGRRGHSNMAHWVSTEEVKDSARIRRRREAKAIIAKESLEALHMPNHSPDPTPAPGMPPAGQESRHG